MKRPILNSLCGVAAVLLFSLPALAQNPPDAGTLTREQERNKPPQTISPQLPAAKKEAPSREDKSGVRFVVKGFRFSGNEGVATTEELNGVVADAVGKEMGLFDLRAYVDRVSDHLRSKGFFLSRAVLPQQKIEGGIVEITVIAGRQEGKANVSFAKDHRIGTQRLQEMVDSAAKPGTPLENSSLERAILLINDIPGVTASTTLNPGKAPGTAALSVDASEGNLFGGAVWGDNYGNRYTGIWRGNTLLKINDPFGYGDQFTASVTAATGTFTGQAGYSFPIGKSGLRASVSYSEMRYKLDEDLVPLDYGGGSRTASASLAYPIVRSRAVNFWVNGGYDYKNLWDETESEKTRDKVVNSGNLGLRLDESDGVLGGGYTLINLGATGGDLDLSGVKADKVDDAQTADSDGLYYKATYGITRVQRLYGGLGLYLSLSGQEAFGNLDSSEKFSLGGPNGVRAYPTGEGSGDSGRTATAELRYDFPSLPVLGTPQLAVFYDAGSVTLHDDPWNNSGTPIKNKNSYSIEGAGVGLNLTNPGIFNLRAAWGRKLGQNPGRSQGGDDNDGHDSKNRYWLSATVNF